MKSNTSGIDEFLSDVVPFFYRRRVTYVDVGAFKGEVFEKILASGLNVGEAHLVEPNPLSMTNRQRSSKEASSVSGPRRE